MKVWVLVIDHKHGTDVSGHASRSAADKANLEYCDEWWGREFPDSEKPPEDALAKEYWRRMSDGGEEWHMLEEREVIGDITIPPVFIPENRRGVKPGYCTRPDIVRLLRMHRMYPERIHFIADMME